MRFGEFVKAVRRRARRCFDIPAPRNPLEAVVQLIQRESHTARARVLSRVVVGLSSDAAEFSTSDVLVLDAEAIALIDALIGDWLSARYSRLELQGAVAAIRWADALRSSEARHG